MTTVLPPIPVVAAVIRDGEDRVLLARRPLHKRHGGLWEFPGGKVEAGETPEAALAREMAGELGVEVEVGPERARVTHAYPDATILLTAHECRILAGEPKPVECLQLAWVQPADFGAYPMPDADLPIALALQRL